MILYGPAKGLKGRETLWLQADNPDRFPIQEPGSIQPAPFGGLCRLHFLAWTATLRESILVLSFWMPILGPIRRGFNSRKTI